MFYDKDEESRCYQYAVSETGRLFGRIGVATDKVHGGSGGAPFYLQLVTPDQKSREVEIPSLGSIDDGYRISITDTGVTLYSASTKGILNGVYDAAERVGYFFLYPGLDGEWQPSAEDTITLSLVDEIVEPRFPHRGVFWEGKNANDYTDEEWLRFYAKLRFNALRHEIDDLNLTDELGLRLEVGGHELKELLPREHYDKHPEWYRLVQPKDFSGQRSNDLNYSVTNEEARLEVKSNFREKLKTVAGVHALHAWPDDLPGGGWCYSSTSRAFSPADQAMLAMRTLAEVVEEEKLPLRIPVLAYHDTLFPGTQVDVSKECFLLFAPRERCYGHALNDPACKRNQVYCQALKEWMVKFENIDDAHTFEYYFDQILFRGIYPFLPGVIIADMSVYQDQRIECHMSLQVGGPAIAPEHNMLLFARAQWDEDLTTESYIDYFAKHLCPEHCEPWVAFLTRRGQIFADALRMCDHDLNNYFDYRWLPETTTPFGKAVAQAYENAAVAMGHATDNLESSVETYWPTRLSELAKNEISRARFETQEFHVMHLQQLAMYNFGFFLNTREVKYAEKGVKLLEQTIIAQDEAIKKAKKAKLPADSYYFKLVKDWLRPEFEEKIKIYRSAIGKINK